MGAVYGPNGKILGCSYAERIQSTHMEVKLVEPCITATATFLGRPKEIAFERVQQSADTTELIPSLIWPDRVAGQLFAGRDGASDGPGKRRVPRVRRGCWHLRGYTREVGAVATGPPHSLPIIGVPANQAPLRLGPSLPDTFGLKLRPKQFPE